MKIIFAGTPQFSVPTLISLIASEHEVIAVYTQPDRPAGRGRAIQVSPIKQCALDNNIPIEQPLNFKEEGAPEKLNKYAADLMVVVAYGLILPSFALQAPRYGCINIHASLLPRWRGAAPIQRAILAGDKETGVTLMQMDEGLDTGNSLLKVRCPIEETDTSASLHNKLATLGADHLATLLSSIETGGLEPKAQDSANATYAKKLTKLEATIDWHQPASALLRNINGFNPWPVAHTLINGKSLRIWQAALTHQSCNSAVGTVTIEQNKLFVACTDQWLEICQLQPANKRVMSASDYIAAHKVSGIVLGN
ncbi:MAG: methionyl-tRNA formyltransferase [Cycloclasticus sp. symbiont of Poecilosclerida sp. M]|nr:MAG: methionyl-tRNA formyltransferase [Cycloclasticus sp. symbiont of Poecilosclerida sp. M]